MSEKTAFEAMQLAGNSPNKDRASNDLGRFGLGLKTASLSQARSLLMTTLQNGARTTLRWDLDAVARAGEWTLEQLNEKETLSALPQRVHDAMPVSHGTCILWRNLDKLETLAGRSLREIDKAMENLPDTLHWYFTGLHIPIPTIISGKSSSTSTDARFLSATHSFAIIRQSKPLESSASALPEPRCAVIHCRIKTVCATKTDSS